MLKEEPEDLTHLAPTAGDVCIPLEDNPFDVFDQFILSDYNLLPEELDVLGPNGPDSFTFYRDDVDSSPLSDMSHSPVMLSPSMSKVSHQLLFIYIYTVSDYIIRNADNNTFKICICASLADITAVFAV